MNNFKIQDKDNGNTENLPVCAALDSDLMEGDAVQVGPYCYCGKGRTLNNVELLCANCRNWFHESCITFNLEKLIPFLSNYIFLCKNCSPSGLEYFKKFQAQAAQMCVTAIANLQQASFKVGDKRVMFSKDWEIIPFIEAHWDTIATTGRRVTPFWHLTARSALVKETNLFILKLNAEQDQMYGLLRADLAKIYPNYAAMIKFGILGVTDCGTVYVPSAITLKNRKVQNGDVEKKIRHYLRLAAIKSSLHGYPLEYPFNKNGYKYFLAERDPHARIEKGFNKNYKGTGKPIPGWLYRVFVPSSVLLSLHDRAPQLRISENRLSVTGENCYVTLRATHAVNRGCWYYEINVDEMPARTECKIGWGQDYCNLQSPLGYDKFGYSWGSKMGTGIHKAIVKSYSLGYGQGDTLGLLILLPETSAMQILPDSYKDRGCLYYQDKNNVVDRLKNLKVLPGSKIIFFKNGICQGIAFQNMYMGYYYPTISLLRNAKVTCNFGPDFKYPPSKSEYNWHGIHERAPEAIYEQLSANILYLVKQFK